MREVNPVTPLRIALIEAGKNLGLARRIKEAARLYKEQIVEKIFIHYPDFRSDPSRLFAVHQMCTGQGVLGDDVIIDQPDLVSFVEESEKGISRLVVITSRLGFVNAWYRFKRMPGLVWEPVRFHVAGVV